VAIHQIYIPDRSLFQRRIGVNIFKKFFSGKESAATPLLVPPTGCGPRPRADFAQAAPVFEETARRVQLPDWSDDGSPCGPILTVGEFA
jgi:hypothetical protein